jgi:hypothetical protein
MPETPPPEPSGVECFPEELAELFIKERLPESKKILTASRRADMKDWLRNPESVSTNPNPVVRQKWANDKAYTNAYYKLQAGQIYQSPEKVKGHSYNARYVACYNDAFDMICRSHRRLIHARKYFYVFICIC